MSKRSVDILIKAKDTASKKFGRVGAAAAMMGRALKSAGRIARTGFIAAMNAAKVAALATAGAITVVSLAAMKQEKAEFQLKAALMMSGQYSDKRFKALKAEASALQEQTVYGDEYIMTLQRMAISQGISAEKSTEAAKAAMAIHAGFGGGRGKPEVFLRYYTDAINGNISSLSSYVLALRGVTDPAKQVEILNKKIADGWVVLTSGAKTTEGSVKQAFNTIGDVVFEQIGNVFLPQIQSAAQAIKKWSEDNKTAIGGWADRAKNSLQGFVNYMKTDWKGGIQWVMDSFLKIMQAAFRDAIVMAFSAGMAISKAIASGIQGKGVKNISALDLFRQRGGQTEGITSWAPRDKDFNKNHTMIEGRSLFGVSKGYYIPNRQRELYQQAKSDANDAYISTSTAGIIKGFTDSIGKNFIKALKDMGNNMPAGLKKSIEQASAKAGGSGGVLNDLLTDRSFLDWRKQQSNSKAAQKSKMMNVLDAALFGSPNLILAELSKRAGGMFSARNKYAAQIFGDINNTPNSAPTIESRFLTMAPPELRTDPSLRIATSQLNIQKSQLTEQKNTNRILERQNGGSVTLPTANL